MNNINIPSWKLSKRQHHDLELIQNGAFSPVDSFLNRDDYESVLENMHLANGKLWPIPIVLDVTESFLNLLKDHNQFTLNDDQDKPLAIFNLLDYYVPNKDKEAISVYKTKEITHAGVNYLYNQTNEIYLSGYIESICNPIYYDYPDLWHTPEQLKKYFRTNRYDKIIAFQTRNPMHKAHVALTKQAIIKTGAKLLIHPVLGTIQTGDLDKNIRIHCYQSILNQYPKNTAILSLLPLSMRMAGPREALWHALIRKNYGCTHFIIGRDHAGPRNNVSNKPFYNPYDAQNLVAEYQSKIGIEMVPMDELVYVPKRRCFISKNKVNSNEQIFAVSGSELRRLLVTDEPVPEWFSYPDVVSILKKNFPPKHKRGLTIFFTGLSGSGKSTLAHALEARLLALGRLTVSQLDGDVVRANLSSELGFSKKDRDLNVLRIGFVASEITKHRGTVICAPIAPYQITRQKIREMISQYGGFIEVYLSTSLEVCETRDPKGLYKKARAGIVANFTGISDPYEVPSNPEITIDTSKYSPSKSVQLIIDRLYEMKYLKY